LLQLPRTIVATAAIQKFRNRLNVFISFFSSHESHRGERTRRSTSRPTRRSSSSEQGCRTTPQKFLLVTTEAARGVQRSPRLRDTTSASRQSSKTSGGRTTSL